MIDIDDHLATIGTIAYEQAIQAGLSEHEAHQIAQQAIWAEIRKIGKKK